MSLRPRYSLLTLLILTAIVAGGVKWWYGPHRVMLNDPLTKEEDKLLMPIEDWLVLFYADGIKFRFEVERFRDWYGERTLWIRLIPLQELTIYQYDTPDTKGCIALIDPGVQQTWNNLVKQGYQIRSSERVVCMMHSGRLPAVAAYNVFPPNPASQIIGIEPQQLDSMTIPKSSKVEAVYEPNLLYALTEQRNIYVLERVSHLSFRLKLTRLERIADPELRTQVEAELDRIPRPR